MEAVQKNQEFQEDDRSSRFLRWALLASLLLHLFFAGGFTGLTRYFSEHFRKQPELTWLEVAPPVDRSRIVQTEAGRKVERAKENAMKGWQNQEVDRETVSKNRMTQSGSGASVPRPLAKSGKQSQTREESAPLAKFGIPMLPIGREQAKPGQESAPEFTQLGSKPMDFIPGVQEGERTALNTKEFVFYGYFQRIRERLDRAWVPLLREKVTQIYRSGRRLASETEHTTKVLVVLNSQGEIIKVRMLSESGSQDLDDAAVKAFNKAGPFPNPPRGIIDAAGEVLIPWDFILRT